MLRVKDVMTTDVVTAGPDTTFPDLVDLLIENHVGGVPIVDDAGVVVGLVTESDLVTKEAFGGHRRRPLEVLADLVAGGQTKWIVKSQGLTAADVMTAEPVTTTPDEELRGAARRMVGEDVTRLPVLADDGHLVGIVTRRDLLHLLHRTDDEIEDELHAVLADPWRAPEHLEIVTSVEDGVVTISGTVESPMDIPVLASLAWQTPGVVDVRTALTARFPAPPRQRI